MSFTVTAYYGSDELTAVFSEEELGTLKYYYDGTTQLLWLRISSPNTTYYWYHGKSTVLLLYQSYTNNIKSFYARQLPKSFKISALCPWGDCSVCGIDYYSIEATTPHPDASNARNHCEKNGPWHLNCRMVRPDTGKQRKSTR
jgi:hypothetical protein